MSVELGPEHSFFYVKEKNIGKFLRMRVIGWKVKVMTKQKK